MVGVSGGCDGSVVEGYVGVWWCVCGGSVSVFSPECLVQRIQCGGLGKCTC